MPKLIQSVEGAVLDYFIGSVYTLKPIVGQIGQEDYINLNSFIAYLQNFTRVEEAESLQKPNNFGLNINKKIVTIEISY